MEEKKEGETEIKNEPAGSADSNQPNPNPAESKELVSPDKTAKKIKWPRVLAIFGIILVLVFLIIVLAALPNPEKYNRFEYNGFSFEKVTMGSAFIYETNFDILLRNRDINYSLKLRKDPRTLEYIPVDYSNFSRYIYFSFTPETLNCTGSALIAAFEIGQYLNNLGINVNAAMTENSSLNTGVNNSNGTNKSLPIKNCSNSDSFVVLLRPYSNETRIYQETPNCIVLEAKNCEVVEVSERFILDLLEKYRTSGTFMRIINS